jgi:hypothetical protein
VVLPSRLLRDSTRRPCGFGRGLSYGAVSKPDRSRVQFRVYGLIGSTKPLSLGPCETNLTVGNSTWSLAMQTAACVAPTMACGCAERRDTMFLRPLRLSLGPVALRRPGPDATLATEIAW